LSALLTGARAPTRSTAGWSTLLFLRRLVPEK